MTLRINLAIGSFAWTIYLLNQYFLKAHLNGGFIHHHLNDLIAPFLLLSLAGLISHGHAAQQWLQSFLGIVTITAAASIVWEIITPALLERSVGDPIDALCYFIGALLFWLTHFLRKSEAPKNGKPTDSEETRYA